VADTGMGIPPDQVAHLFEPLATIVSAAPVDRRTRTCGFGLPICHRIVQMMGGHIDVLSRAGIGSTFSFTLELPVVIEETNGPNPAAQPLAKRSIQILIADSKVQGRLATVLLQGAGHIVTEAATGVEALNRFTEGCFDLVLLDVEMPDLSCTEATKAIRATEPPGRRTPIYALAAASPEAEKERWFQAGMTGFLERPLSPELLLQLASAIGVVKENSSKPMDHHVDLPDETPVATSVGYRET
jgi:CheY-like chemotaxis protein